MPRKKCYGSEAEKQRAYRLRKRMILVEKEAVSDNERQETGLGQDSAGVVQNQERGKEHPETVGVMPGSPVQSLSKQILPVPDYEREQDHRNMPEVPAIENAKGETEQQRDSTMPAMRRQENSGNKEKERILGQNKTKPEETSESGSQHGCIERQDSKAVDMPKVWDGVSVNHHPRTSPRLREEIRSSVAVSPVPRERTFARDLVLAEPTTKAKSKGGEARESTTEHVVPGDFRGGQTLSSTDQTFEDDRPGWYIFRKEIKERNCWKCGKKFSTRLEMNKFCSPKCKNEYLDTAFTKLRNQ